MPLCSGWMRRIPSTIKHSDHVAQTRGDLSLQVPDYQVRLPAPRLLAVIPLTALVIVLALNAAAYNAGFIMRLAPAVVAIWMTWLYIFNLWGHEVISATGGVLRIEAQLAGKTITSREFEVSDVRRLRLERAGFRRPQLASGLPLFAYTSGVGLAFDYRGDRFTLAGALDQPERAVLLAALASEVGVDTGEA